MTEEGEGMQEEDRSGSAEDFVALRPLLFSLAYQMTGSVADGEDIVSEAYLRLRRAQAAGTRIGSLRPYLSSIVTRLSIDHLRSAQVRRETYVGPWLPEPLVESDRAPEFERVELADTLSMAFLVLLETLTPIERAVFLLRDVFGFEYPRIASILDATEAHCRQLLSRARRRVEARRPRFDVSRQQREQLADRFFGALDSGDLDPLVTMLAADVVAYADGGGNRPSLPLPVHGRDKVLRLLTAVSEGLRGFDLRLRRVLVNGQPGALVLDAGGRLVNVVVLDILDEVVQAVRTVVNPDKLRHLGPLISPDHPVLRPGRSRARATAQDVGTP